MSNNMIPSVVIKSIEFNNGKTIEFNADDIVLLVGANNVGKSRTLKDLKSDLDEQSETKILIKKICYNTINFTKEALIDYFNKNIEIDVYGNYNYTIDGHRAVGFSIRDFDDIDRNPKIFYKVLYSFLSTENRLKMTKPYKPGFGSDRSSLNVLKKLESDSASICSLNNVLDLAFGKAIDVYEEYEGEYIVKEYKIGESAVVCDAIKSNGREEKNILSELDSLHIQGDGIRSAVAILSSIIANEHSLCLIDEPETFLHPPQAKLIGKNIVELSKDKQCFIATHNIDFIKGVVEANPSRVKIIKIDRTDNENTFSLINNETVVQISNDKNLKYTNILNGLFYNCLVLCENESDCKFYGAILESLDTSKYQSTLFCAVGGKEQFKKVIPLLKELCINYLIIADVDLISNKNSIKQLLNSIQDHCYEEIKEKHTRFLTLFEENTNSQVKTQTEIKKEINDLFTNEKYISQQTAEKIKSVLKDISSLKLLKTGGKSILPSGECTTLFFDVQLFLKEHNVYVLECGEIERFVPSVGGHGNAWLEKVFQRYNDINDSVYRDAKDFVKAVFDI